MDTIQLVLLSLLVGAVILDQLYRFRVLMAPPSYEDVRDRRPEPQPQPKRKKKPRRNSDHAPYSDGQRQGDGSRRRDSRRDSQGSNGHARRESWGGGGGFSPP